MKIRIVAILLIFVFFGSCTRNNPDNKGDLDKNIGQDFKKNDKSLSLPVSYNKLRIFIGDNFEIIDYKLLNLDSDISNELILCYRENQDSPVSLIIFDILPSEILKKLYMIKTDILYKDDFIITINNLFYQDDRCVILEGSSAESKKELYILQTDSMTFNMAAHFTATYSVFIDYNLVETGEEDKYYLIKEIVLIDSALSATNTTIQRKDIYKWNYDKKSFSLSETSQIVSNENSDIPGSVYLTNENYYNFLKGFWYPEKYKILIDENKLDSQNYTKNNIQYLFVGETAGIKEISVNFGDYIDTYTVDKITKLGGQKSGLRFLIKDPSYSNLSYFRYIDIYLMDSGSLKYKGPDDIDSVSYVRLPKPFIEYITAKNAENTTKIQEKNLLTIRGVYDCNGMKISLKNDNSYEINTEDGKKTETGIYKFINNQDYVIFNLISKADKSLIEDNYFSVNIDNPDRIVLQPLILGFDSVKNKNVKPLVLTRKSSDN